MKDTIADLTWSQFYNIESISDLFKGKNVKRRNGFRHVEINNDYVFGELLYINFEGIVCCYQDWNVYKPFKLAVNSLLPTIKIQFEMEGGEFEYDNELEASMELLSLNYQFVAKYKTNSILQYRKSRKVVDIYMTEAFLVQLLQSQGYCFASLYEILQDSINLFKVPVAITAIQYDMLTSLIYHDYNDQFAIEFIKCRVRELIISVFKGASNLFLTEKFRMEDQLIISQRKKYQDIYFKEDFRMNDLSKQFCINEYKLKYLFKCRYQDTIFSYIRKLRMKYAYNLLVNSPKCIKEIAYETGFKYAHHFTRNFVKQYGVLPKDVRQLADK